MPRDLPLRVEIDHFVEGDQQRGRDAVRKADSRAAVTAAQISVSSRSLVATYGFWSRSAARELDAVVGIRDQELAQA